MAQPKEAGSEEERFSLHTGLSACVNMVASTNPLHQILYFNWLYYFILCDFRMTQRSALGYFSLQFDPALHATPGRAASLRRVSFYAYCADRLAASIEGSFGAEGTMRRAGTFLGESLIGLAGFGPWARGRSLSRLTPMHWW